MEEGFPFLFSTSPAGRAGRMETHGLLETTCFIHFVVLLIVFAGLYSLFLLKFFEKIIWKNPNPLCWISPVSCNPKPQYPDQKGQGGREGGIKKQQLV